ncbi:MAG: choline dehydrogenase [Bacteroidota bacterium]
MVDYIIIGGGSAGCVLANRLSEDPAVEVLLLEAGKKDNHLNISIPAAFSKLFKSSWDWAFYSTPQAHMYNKELFLPRGKTLGGSSSINAMIYIRGHKLDYDHWAKLGNEGWGYDDILPYFKKSIHQERGADDYHGVNGPQNVADVREPFPMSKAFIKAGEELGYKQNPDFNGKEQDGFGMYQVTQKDGKRQSSARSFLRPAMKRPNLTVLTEAPAQRIIIENGRAVGIEYQTPTHVKEVRARKEVILCAGAYQSPQLLMLSGIGPADHLQLHDIEVKLDLPGVGENLLDHLIVPMIFKSQAKASLDDAENISNLLKFLVWGEGPLTCNVAEGGAFVRTLPELPAPDIQYHMGPAFFKNHGFERLKRGRAISFGPTLLQPESIGRISLQSNRPGDAPLIDHNYLARQEDVDALSRGIKIGYELAHTEALRPFAGKPLYPKTRLFSDNDIEEYIRRNAQTLYHPVGTCKMGQDDMAVVDDQLRVHGIDGLRVVDASVMPTIVRGNTHAPVMMIAERAADLIQGKVRMKAKKAMENVSS